jgi:RecB family exonuclease
MSPHVNGHDPRALLEAIQSSAAQVLTSMEDLPVAVVLSASQTNMYLGCPAKWGYKYISKLPEQRGGSLVRGTAVHRIAEAYYRLKLKSGGVPSDTSAFVAEVLEDVWEAGLVDASFAPDEKPDELKAQASALSLLYLTDIAPQITPVAIEERVTGTIGGVNIQGYIDVLDDAGTIQELKTAAKSPSAKAPVTPGYAFQAATYAQLEPRCGGLVQLTTMVATKTPKAVVTVYEVTGAGIRMTEQIYPAVQEAMKQGRVLPNRESNLCSRKYCSFAAQCEKDWGGTVKGECE